MLLIGVRGLDIFCETHSDSSSQDVHFGFLMCCIGSLHPELIAESQSWRGRPFDSFGFGRWLWV